MDNISTRKNRKRPLDDKEEPLGGRFTAERTRFSFLCFPMVITQLQFDKCFNVATSQSVSCSTTLLLVPERSERNVRLQIHEFRNAACVILNSFKFKLQIFN